MLSRAIKYHRTLVLAIPRWHINQWHATFSFTVWLTHWGRVTHICVTELTTIGSDNGLSPGRRQAIIWINAGLLSVGPLGTNFGEVWIEILPFSFKKIHSKMCSAKMAAILSRMGAGMSWMMSGSKPMVMWWHKNTFHVTDHCERNLTVTQKAAIRSFGVSPFP